MFAANESREGCCACKKCFAFILAVLPTLQDGRLPIVEGFIRRGVVLDTFRTAYMVSEEPQCFRTVIGDYSGGSAMTPDGRMPYTVVSIDSERVKHIFSR